MKRLVKAIGAVVAAVGISAGVVAAPAANAQFRPPITWEQCPVHVDVEGAKCGRILVPMRYDNPALGDISIGFVKVPAKVPAARRGVLFGNPGGPGLDAYSYFASKTVFDWPQEIQNEWDLIAVQPRGLMHSTDLNCAMPEPQNGAEMAKLQYDATVNPGAVNRELCEKSRPGYTASITTYSNARDWDMVRWALGEDRISILGLSYGTYLGAAYASMFPHRTNKVVLDSAMDTNAQWQHLIATQLGGYERALHQYFAWVAANDATYHMGDTPLKAYQTWSAAVVREAGTNPTVTPPPARVGDLPPGLEFAGQAGADAMTATGRARVEGEGIVSRFMNPGANQANSRLLAATRELLPVPAGWDFLARLTNGSATLPPENDGSANPALKAEAEGQMRALFQLQAVQLCNENITPTDYSLIPRALWAQATGDIFTAAAAGVGGGMQCNGAPGIIGPIPLDGSKLQFRPLQFNGTGDPQTVYSGRFAIANPMNSHLVTVHGPGHGHVGLGNPAVDRQVVAYLRTGELGPVDQPGYFEAK